MDATEAVLASWEEDRAPPHEEGAPLSDSQWRELVRAYSQREPFVSESLQFARYHIKKEGRVQLIFPARDELRYRRLASRENCEPFERFCSERGHRLQIEVFLHDRDELPSSYQFSLFEQQEALHLRRQRELRREAEEHPIIRAFLEKVPGTEILRVEALTSGQEGATSSGKSGVR